MLGSGQLLKTQKREKMKRIIQARGRGNEFTIIANCSTLPLAILTFPKNFRVEVHRNKLHFP